MSDKMKIREGKDGYSYPYTSPDLVIDQNGKSTTTKFNELENKIEKVGSTSIDDTNTATDKTWSSSKIDTQFKDIANLSLTKHTDGKIYIKKQDGTLIGDGIEIGGSDVDLSKITMSMSGQTLKLLNNGTQISTVEIPTATVTDEQLTSIIQSKIDDGTLGSLTIEDGSIGVEKLSFLTEETNTITDTTTTESNKIYFSSLNYKAGMYNNSGSYVSSIGQTSDLIDFSTINEIYISKWNKNWTNYGAITGYDSDKNFIRNYRPAELDDVTGLLKGYVNITDDDIKYISFTVENDTHKEESYYITKGGSGGSTTTESHLKYEGEYIGTISEEPNIKKTYSSKKIDNLDLNRSKWQNKKIIVDGESLTANGNWHTYLKTWLSLSTVYNHAVAGVSMTYTASNPWRTRLEAYETDADAIILLGDHNSIISGTIDDTTDDTWFGQWNQYLQAIITKFPTTPIILASHWKTDSQHGDNAKNKAIAFKNLSDKYGLHYVDFFNDFIFRYDNTDSVTKFGLNGTNKVHLNKTYGNEAVAQRFYEEFKKIYIPIFN